MKVLLSTPPGFTTERWPPLGLLYIASNLRRFRSDEIHILDAFCENLTKADLVRRVVQGKPDVFGINCSTHTFLAAVEALRDIRRSLPDTILVMGGYHATFAAEQILRTYPFVDFILKGEAEYALPKLLDRLEDGQPPADVEGISFLDGDAWVDRPLTVVQDLDALPFPDRSLLPDLPYGYYHQNIRLTFGKFTTICTSRGCPFSCRYCSCAAFSRRRWRARKARSVVDELELLESEGYETVVFVDDNFTLDKKRVLQICEELRARRIRLRYYCEGRVDNAPYSLLREMKRVGFDVIYFGVESPSPHVLRYYDKAISAQQAETAVADAKRAGMLVVTSFIIGAPVESRADVEHTIDFIRRLRPHAVQVNILDCLIGTPIWDELSEQGVVGPEDWMRNHRIWEYHQNGLTAALLRQLSRDAYGAHIAGWRNKASAREILRVLLRNKSGRRVILGNLLNAEVARRLREGFQSDIT